MGLHAYCIVPAHHLPAAGLSGVDGASVRIFDAAGLGVWASEHAQAPAPSIDTVRVHNEVVQQAMTPTVTPVPIRYGQWFNGEGALGERLGEEHDRWAAQLAALAGHAELGVAVAGEREQDAARDVRPAAAETGTAYMRVLAERQALAAARRRDAERIAADITARLEGIAAQTRVETPGEGAILVRTAHLVAWPRLDAYHAAVRELRESSPQLQFYLTGPWPPWSFA